MTDRSWVIRHATLAYSILTFGLVLSVFFTKVQVDAAIERTNAKARTTCQAGNERSRLAVQSLEEQRHRTEAFDFATLAIVPSQAVDLKRQALDSVDRQIGSLPFLNCITGKRAPAPGVP